MKLTMAGDEEEPNYSIHCYVTYFIFAISEKVLLGTLDMFPSQITSYDKQC